MPISKAQELEVNVAGSSTFGLYPKISSEKSYNFFLSLNVEDQTPWMVNYAGFQKVAEVNPNSEGRGIFNSIRGGFLIGVVGANVYRLNTNLAPVLIGTLSTLVGDVYIDENLSSQICLVDGKNAYIYNYSNNTFTLQTLIFVGNAIFPSYVCYHNTFFLFGSSPVSVNSSFWYAFEFDTPTTIKFNTQFSLQTKPDVALAVERLPGRGNNVLVLGSTVAEVWTQVGGLENYRRVQSFNIDNGLVAASTLAASDDYICWLSKNENNSPCIMITNGSSNKRISTDGIDHVLDQLEHPEQSSAFFYRQDGHIFYQITFFNPADNLTLIYDFTTEKFFHVSDENLNYHPARQIVYFNEETYFISLNDGDLYNMDTRFVTYNYNLNPNLPGQEIPRIRICAAIRKKNSDRFRVGKFSVVIEQGVNSYFAGNPVIPRVDMSFSKNGGQSFSNVVGIDLNTAGNFRNQLRWWKLGQANEFIIQLRFLGLQRFVIGPAIAETY